MTYTSMDILDFDHHQTEASTSIQEDESGPCCLVCGRVANTGHHYGVTACLGCKTFFRRVVLQPNPPKCKLKNQCRLEKSINAKRLCRSCRYQKCKEVGMTEEALHPCRDVIGRRNRHSIESSPCSSPPSIPVFVENGDHELLQQISEMDTEIRTRTAHILGEPENGNTKIHFYSPTCNYENVTLNHGIGPSLKVDILLLREWVNRLPGFQNLTQFYQNYLLRKFCLRYTVIEHGLFTTQMPPNKNVWFLSDRTCLVTDFVDIPEEIRKLLTPSVIEEQKTFAPFTSMLINEVAEPLRFLKLNSIEVAAVKVLMLIKPTCLQSTTGDIATYEDVEIVKKLRNQVISGLHSYYAKSGMNINQLAIRLGEVIMFTGGVEVCADRALEEMHYIRFFGHFIDPDSVFFDPHSSDVIFGFSRDF